MTKRVSLGAGAEFDRIRTIWSTIADRSDALGDDAAIVTVGSEQLAISSDMVVEGHHFRTAWLTPVEIGWRATMGALSDLAAVAANPAGLLASVAVPWQHSGDFLTMLMEGIAGAATAAGATVWGGDLAAGEAVVVDVLVVGSAPQPVLRSGAQPGDGLWVTGSLGGPHEAVLAWSASRTPAQAARERFAHPVARIGEGAWLRDRGAKAMIDLSDGLAGDASHLAAASGVACVIDAGRVPCVADVAWESAVLGGEEYELLVALPGDWSDDNAGEFATAFDIPLTQVGKVREGRGVRVEQHGNAVDIGGGFSHF